MQYRWIAAVILCGVLLQVNSITDDVQKGLAANVGEAKGVLPRGRSKCKGEEVNCILLE